ncbi:MAG: hypothetical protein KAW45_02220 [Thermoplasmatales archaeon]|nr:hypothetical protein [Thermoplasmatales archaeon]
MNRKAIKPKVHKVPLIYSIVLFATTISLLLCIGLCVVHSLGAYNVKDVGFFQDFAVGAFTFIGGFLMGGNLSK